VTFLRGRGALLLWLALMVGVSWIVFGQTRVTTDLTSFLPRGASPFERLLLEQLRTGATARVIVIALEGAPHEVLTRSSRLLAQRLRRSGLFTYVNNGDASSWTARDRELLFDDRYLLSPGTVSARFTSQVLHASLEERLQTLLSPLGAMEKRLLPRDPTGEFQRVLQIWVGARASVVAPDVWFAADGQQALLVAETRAPPFELDAQSQAVVRIRSELAALPEGRAVTLLLSGPPVFAVEARDRIRKELTVLSALAVAAVVSFLLIVYRSPLLLLLAALPLLTAVLAGVASVRAVFGAIHGITLAFGSTIIGVAVDYPIHLFSHIRAKELPTQTIVRIWPTLRLGVLTTALGYTAMLFSKFPGLSQLGLFAATGLFAAAAVTRWVLPVLIGETIKRNLGGSVLSVSLALEWLGRLRWLAPVMIGAGAIYVATHSHSLWEADLAHLSPISAAQRATDEALRTAVGVPDVRKLLVVTGTSAEDVLQCSEHLTLGLDELASRRVLDGYETPSRYLPSERTQRLRQTALPAEGALREALRSATQGLPFRRDLFEPFIADVAAAKISKPLEVSDFHDSVLALRLGSLLFQRGGYWVGLVPLRGVTDDAALSAWVSSLRDANVHYVDLKETANTVVNRYRRQMLPLLAWGSGAIVLVLWLGLRSITVVLRVLLPVSAAVVGVVASLALLGQPLSMFHLAALLLVVGVGLDYGLFFNRAAQDSAEREQTARALVVCAISTALVFGILAFSRTPVLAAIGSTVAVGVSLCFILAAAFARGVGEAATSGA
jgi:predicted exporter